MSEIETQGRRNSSKDMEIKTATDTIQKELRQGFVWSTKHSQIVFGSVLVLVVGWGGILIKDYFQSRTEASAQEALFPIEKTYLDKKEKFDQAATQAAANALKSQDKNTGKAKADLPAGNSSSQLATGDVAKDFGTETAAFENIITKHSNTKAAMMAAIYLAEIQTKYGKSAEAEATLKRVSSSGNSMISGLVLKLLGTTQANLNNCSGAIDTWKKVLMISEAKALSNEVRLNMALCYESMQDFGNAEKMYLEIKNTEPTSPVARTAENYLKVLKTKSNQTK